MGTLFASGLARSERNTKAGTAVPIDRMAEVEKHRRMTIAIKAGDAQLAAKALLEIAAGFERHFQQDTRKRSWLLFLTEWFCAPGSPRAVPKRFALSFIVSKFVPAFTGAAVEIVNYFA